MLIPPKPWSAPNIGGYLSNQSLIMRVRGSTMQINQLFAQHKQGKLSQVRNAFMHSCIVYTSGVVGSKTYLGGHRHHSAPPLESLTHTHCMQAKMIRFQTAKCDAVWPS